VNRAEHLLTCLAEECAEVAQRVSKALRFGLSEVQPGQASDNADRIADEVGDLISVIGILVDEGIIPDPIPDQREKLAKIERFMAISREQGTLDDQPPARYGQ
jgi:NTP pyrophosphatase (non-canonical NTP hydrolase)